MLKSPYRKEANAYDKDVQVQTLSFTSERKASLANQWSRFGIQLLRLSP